jgi:hypothetical protein
MLYNRLSNEELERWTNASPADTEAQAELLRRVPGLIEQNDDDLEEAREIAQQAEANQDRANWEKEAAEEAATAAESKLNDACNEIDDLKARVKELTCAEGLV